MVLKGNFNSNNKKKENDVGNGDHNRHQLFSSSNSLFYESEEIKIAFDDRLNYLLINAIGSNVTVTVPSGVKYSGLLTACNQNYNGGVNIILKFPKIVDKGFSDTDLGISEGNLAENLVIYGTDVAELELNDIEFIADGKCEYMKEEQEIKHGKICNSDKKKQGFKTDIDILKPHIDVKERELQKWSPECDEDFELEGSLEDADSHWDQFAVNEKKFGIKSTFDEHLYTTRINKDDPNYHQRLKEADKIAREIESQGASNNVHVAEDRGFILDDQDLDEEDKYSGVDRRGDELLAQLKLNAKPTRDKTSKYVPPSLRNQPHHVDPAILSASSVSKEKTLPSPNKISKNDVKMQTNDSNKVYKKNEVPDGIEHVNISEKPEVLDDQKTNTGSLKVSSPVTSGPTTQVTNASDSGVKSFGAPKLSASSSETIDTTQSPVKGRTLAKSCTESPMSTRGHIFRRRNTVSIFKNNGPLNVKKDFNKNFNMFLKTKDGHSERRKELSATDKSMEPFFIEKPYFTTPTWISTVESSYKSLFPDERTAIQSIQMKLQQRNINVVITGTNNMPITGIPNMLMATGRSHNGPFITNPNAGGMFVPFQPQPIFYPPVPQMIPVLSGNLNNVSDDIRNNGPNSPSSRNASPHGAPIFINSNGSQFGYPISFQPIMVNHGNHGNYRGHYHHYNRHYKSQDSHQQ